MLWRWGEEIKEKETDRQTGRAGKRPEKIERGVKTEREGDRDGAERYREKRRKETIEGRGGRGRGKETGRGPAWLREREPGMGTRLGHSPCGQPRCCAGS